LPRRFEGGRPLAREKAIVSDGRREALDRYRVDAGLSHGDLWLRYFELGGMSSALELEAILYGALRPSAHNREVIAHALNERFVELGGNHPVPYLAGPENGSEDHRSDS
jgi:hypothetical protein